MRKYMIEINGCELIEIETDLDLYSELTDSQNEEVKSMIKISFRNEYDENCPDIFYWKPKGYEKI